MRRLRRPRRRLSFLHTLIVVAIAMLVVRYVPLNDRPPIASLRQDLATLQGHAAAQSDPVLTQQRLRHITDGDHTGGGHLSGTGAPCKSEFPPHWTREKIAHDLPLIAANDNLRWQDSTQGNGYQVAEAATADGLVVRIVVNPRSNEIITAYPVNVRRNPCPASNDNRRR